MVDSILFHSASEAARYKILKILERAGEICNIQLQVPYHFIYNGAKIFTYYADFVYVSKKGETIIEDVKSKATQKLAVYRLKKKLIEAKFGIVITEVYGIKISEVK